MKTYINLANTAFFLLILMNCQSREQRTTGMKVSELKSEINLDEVIYTVLDYDSSYYWLFPANSMNIDLGKGDMIVCEQLLNKSLEIYNQEQKILLVTLRAKYPTQNFRDKDFFIFKSEYGRQYVAASVPTGLRLVHINFFCNPENYEYWKEEYLFVDDGGNCFFQVTINLDTKKVINFSVNGWA